MRDLKLLEKRGATHHKFKSLFESKEPSEKIKQLQELHSSRLRRGIESNISKAPIYGAIDRSLEAAQANLPYIQARELASSGRSHEEVIAAFKNFQLDRMLVEVADPVTGKPVVDPKNPSKPLLTFNQPIFDNVFVPLTAAYCDIRVAKLFNDRNLYPRYKYSPPSLTQTSMAIGEIITGRVQKMSEEMGYAEDDKQSFQKMVRYGECFNFPKEPYWRESYWTTDNGKDVKKTMREGVRFAIPHPRRSGWDEAFPLYTFNTDTGVSFTWYWDIIPYRDIKDNELYWNRDKITYGGYSIFSTPAWRIWQQFYPCVVKFPTTWDTSDPGANDRLTSADNLFPANELDASVTHAALFHKLVPKDWGLFDYDEPVWMRFLYANLDTCIHAEVFPYTPGYVYLDRYDADKTVNASLALQLSPFQQLLGNFLTQHFRSVKENLLRVSFVNTDIVPADQISWLKRQKDRLYQGHQFLMYSQKHNQILEQDQRSAVTSMQVPQVITNELRQNIQLVLMVLERMLGFSSQEVGAPASHEQSATEVNVISTNTSVNVEFMGSGIDAAWGAKKRLLYTAFYCYGDDDEFFADVNDLTPERRKALKELGFEIQDGAKDGALKYTVKGKKAALKLDRFISEREGVNRLNDSKLGIGMLQNLGQVIQNPLLFQSLGVQQIIRLFNYVWRAIGMPQDFEAKPLDTKASPEQQQQQFLQILAQAKDAIVKEAVTIVDQQMKQSVVGPLSEELAKLAQGLQQAMQGVQQLAAALAQNKQEDDAQSKAIVQINQGLQQVEQVIAAAQQQQQQQQPQPVIANAPINPADTGYPAGGGQAPQLV